MTLRVAINGFGRIGRLVLRSIIEHGRRDIEVVAINDLGPVETNAHLLRFDSVHGRFPGLVTVDGDSIQLGRQQDQGHRGPRSEHAAVEGTRHRYRARMHRHVHAKREGRRASGPQAPSACWSARPPMVLTSHVFGVNHDKMTKEHLVVSNGLAPPTVWRRSPRC
jgi:glyceraldehyde 3-phosphate dehydrogenase